MTLAADGPQCPICESATFGPYNGRPNAACRGCGSVERGRLLWVILNQLGLPNPASRILHVAPEKHLYERFKATCGELYHPCDFNPQHPNYVRLGGVFPIDLCHDLFRFPSALFDLIVHNHVLEHLPCTIEPILREHIRILRPGGYFVFSVPFRDQQTHEDFSSRLSPDDRRIRFGQADHMRIFGTVEFPEMLERTFGHDARFPIEDHWVPDQLAAWAIPYNPNRKINGSTVFVHRKDGQHKGAAAEPTAKELVATTSEAIG